ncbi:hypothetical protein D8S78_15805 [Natrialba swarupiae]|nr:hypothetical protein [Natrialba swarupiae]
MTDSTIENKPGDGGFDIGSSADELFREIAEEPSRPTSTETKTASPRTTRASKTRPPRRSSDSSKTKSIAPEPTSCSPTRVRGHHRERGRTRTRAGGRRRVARRREALTNLLLTERTKGEEFLWIDAGDSAGVNDSDDSPSDAPSTDDRSAESTAEGDVAEDAAGATESTDSNDEPATETQRSVLETNARPDEGDRAISSDDASTDSSESSPFAADESEDEPDEPDLGEIEPAEPEFSDIEPEGIGFADSDPRTTRSTRSEVNADPTETDESDGDSTSEPSTESDSPEGANDVPTGFSVDSARSSRASFRPHRSWTTGPTLLESLS